jgi:hypothetical protein
MELGKSGVLWPVWAAGVLMVGMATAAMAAKLSAEEAKTLRDCMVMKSEEAVRDVGCQPVLRKEKITKVDLDMMKSCEGKLEAAADNPDCVAMVNKHPDLARGHGMDEPGKSTPP